MRDTSIYKSYSQTTCSSKIYELSLKPVQSAKALNQVQIDLVDMSASPLASYTGCHIQVYPSCIGCFLHPLQSKSSADVARRLIEIFSDTGPPV